MTQVHIPIVDIAPFREGNPEGSRHAVERIGHACEEIGFKRVSENKRDFKSLANRFLEKSLTGGRSI